MGITILIQWYDYTDLVNPVFRFFLQVGIFSRSANYVLFHYLSKDTMEAANHGKVFIADKIRQYKIVRTRDWKSRKSIRFVFSMPMHFSFEIYWPNYSVNMLNTTYFPKSSSSNNCEHSFEHEKNIFRAQRFYLIFF